MSYSVYEKRGKTFGAVFVQGEAGDLAAWDVGTRSCTSLSKTLIKILCELITTPMDGILKKPGGDLNARFRMFIDPGNKNYNQIVLQKYGQDLRALYKLGWKLPEGVTEEEFNQYLANLENLANRPQNGQ